MASVKNSNELFVFAKFRMLYKNTHYYYEYNYYIFLYVIVIRCSFVVTYIYEYIHICIFIISGEKCLNIN